MDAKRTGHARAENGRAEMSRLSWSAASVLFKQKCFGNDAHAATHDRAYCQCVSQFSFLPSERIGDIEPSTDQGAGGIRGLYRFDQHKFRSHVRVSTKDAVSADRQSS